MMIVANVRGMGALLYLRASARASGLRRNDFKRNALHGPSILDKFRGSQGASTPCPRAKLRDAQLAVTTAISRRNVADS